MRTLIACLIIPYIASILWCLCFPLVSITTGELKPRGIYVDETSLQSIGQSSSKSSSESSLFTNSLHLQPIMSSGRLELSYTDNTRVREYSLHSLCDLFEEYSSSCSFSLIPPHNDTKTARDQDSFVYEVVIDNINKPVVSDEVIVLVFPISVNQQHSVVLAVNMAHQLVSSLISNEWLAKRVIVLISSEEGAVDQWLRRYHQDSQVVADSVEVGDNIGVIRESYVIDMRGENDRDSEYYRATNDTHYPDSIYEWHDIQLNIVGDHGQLPNMDVFSSLLLSQFGNVITLESHESKLKHSCRSCFQWLQRVDNAIQLIHSGRASSVGVKPGKPAADSADREVDLKHEYLRRLSGLVAFCLSLMNGSTGLHGFFIERNIDSFTLLPRRVTNTRKTGQPVNSLDVSKLLTIINSVIRSSSSLQGNNLIGLLVSSLTLSQLFMTEELHHSHFQYLLMGSKHFVGMGEYLPSLGLSLAPLLGLYLYSFHVLSPVHSRPSNDYNRKTTSFSFMNALFLWILLVVVSVLCVQTSAESVKITEGLTEFVRVFICSISWEVSIQLAATLILSCVIIKSLKLCQETPVKSPTTTQGVAASSSHQRTTVTILGDVLLLMYAGLMCLGIQNYCLAYFTSLVVVPLMSALSVLIIYDYQVRLLTQDIQ